MDGLPSSLACGEIFSGTTDGKTHTPRTPPSSVPPVGFPLAAPLSMAPGPELVSVSLPPDCGGCLGDWPFHQGCGDAGSIESGEETLASSHFPRMRMPLRRRNLTRNGPGGESPARWMAQKEREESAQPLSFPKSASDRIDRKRRATSHWRHRRRAMRPLGFGSPPASVWSGAFPPVDGALVPLDSRRKRAEKIRPRGTLGALILSCRLNRGLNWATSWGRCSAHARGNHNTSGGGKTGDGPRPNATAGRAFWALSKGAELDVDALGPEAERGPFCVPWADLSH